MSANDNDDIWESPEERNSLQFLSSLGFPTLTNIEIAVTVGGLTQRVMYIRPSTMMALLGEPSSTSKFLVGFIRHAIEWEKKHE